MSSREATILEILNIVNPLQHRNYKPISIIYPGGKSKVAKTIINQMPPHEKYVEPFAGAAHVFFKKPKAKKNVLNDINKNLIRFFKEIKDNKICCDISPSYSVDFKCQFISNIILIIMEIIVFAKKVRAYITHKT